MKKGGLGKGLDALFADNSEEAGNGAVMVRLTEIEPNRSQPRKKFDEDALEQLSESIKLHGVLQPLVIRPIPGVGSYQLVAGERRWRASRMAGLTEVPAVIRELDDNEAMQIALIENLQREDLNPLEEAEGFQMLMKQYGMTQEEVSGRVGRSRPAVANSLRLLGLPGKVQEMLRAGKLSSGHARTLLAIEDPEKLLSAAQEVADHGLSVRDVEKLVKASQKTELQEKKKTPSPEKTMMESEIERGLAEQLGRKIRVTKGKNRGTLEIEFYDDEDLKQLSNLLCRE